MQQVNDYLKIIERYKEYPEQYYRGQLEKYVTMPSSIARDQGYSLNESAIYYESIEMKKEEFKELNTPLERLAKLQHYGIPTRLVDVTIKPLIALYFAVEDVDDLSPGNVYLYLINGKSVNSKEANLLSLLPTLPVLNIDNIRSEYEKLFKDSLSDKEILKIVNKPVIIRYTKELQKTNPRLYSQQGTFLICGNAVVDNVITDSLISLDTITPNLIIRIPYEYKKKIKDELDLQYGINQLKIYPELPLVATYIKEKYKKINISFDGKYSIVKKEDSSHALAKRISICIVLNEMLQIQQIKEIVINIIEQYKQEQNVVWVYVARNGDAYILSNWILCGQWIDPNLKEEYQPMHLEKQEDGFYWKYNKSYSTDEDFYQQYIFEDDKDLFVNHKKVWKKFLEIYEVLYYVYRKNSWNDFVLEIEKQKAEITTLYMKVQEFGCSHNREFDDFLREFSYFISPIDDIRFLIDNDTLLEKGKRYQISRVFGQAENKKMQIEQGLLEWEDELGITNEDYQSVNPFHQT